MVNGEYPDKASPVTSGSVNEDPEREITFAEMQEQESARKKSNDRWQKFRIAGIHIFAMGLATILAVWSFQSSFSKASGTITPISQLSVYVVALVIVGAVIAFLGVLLFVRGQIALNKSHRNFMKTMAIIIAKEQNQK